MSKRGIEVLLLVLLAMLLGLAALVAADVPGRLPPRGTAPNPGAQQQELPNITFPAPYNVFEFPVTCMACHGGTIDQTAGHGGNWAGTSMASAARDPVFRANQIIVNSTIKNLSLGDGAGNLCFRCHSPNGWLSGRFDPTLGGAADGSDMIQSILLSTDTEGVNCEQCHRAIGGVTMKRPDLDPADPVWNMMSGLLDWPHAGNPYPAGPTEGNPYGDSTLQYHDGMSYGARYGGNVELFFSDLPLVGFYTGQTYGVVPWWFTGPTPIPPPGLPSTNPLGELIWYNPDGSIGFVFEAGVKPDDLWGAISPEHSTRISDFVKSPEFCGSCHEVTVPILNHGMYEQRTYTEWKYSAYGQGTSGLADARCQGCHMPTLKHEYSDTAPVSLNPDPLVSGWYPYSKDRNIGGGTSFHKLAGGNRDLPMMMKVLYPEVDLEVIGAPTGHDPMIFPGMFTDRGPMWDRNRRNTEISLRDSVSAQILGAPTLVDPATGTYRVQVQVTNNAGHKVPSGYPDGRRMFISLVVKDAAGAVVYQSGYYDPATAQLFNDSSKAGLSRAITPAIDSAANAVMIYEKRTGTVNPDGTFKMSPSLLNERVLFDNRIPPAGFDSAAYSANGASFWTYTGTEAAATPVEDTGRYSAGQNWDLVTYTFTVPTGLGAPVSARAEVLYESHSREFMEFLKDAINALPAADQGPVPQGPPNPMSANPIAPTILSDNILLTTGQSFASMTDLAGNALQDNWGGIAYAAWLHSGKGVPYVMAADDTAVAGPPSPPASLSVGSAIDPATGLNDPNVQVLSWPAVAGADGYLLWVRYGKDPNTSDWDRLAVVLAPQTQLSHVGLNPGKTFAYQVQAFNAKGYSDRANSPTAVAQTPAALPLPPINTRVVGVTDTTVTLAWYDQADNEDGFVVQRQDVAANGQLGPWVTLPLIPSQTLGPTFGGNTWTDTGLVPGNTYNYHVAAYNVAGRSAWDLTVTATTTRTVPAAPTGLTGTGVVLGEEMIAVQLAWTDNSNNELSFVVQRAPVKNSKVGPFVNVATLPANSTAYSDQAVLQDTQYAYRVYAFNTIGASGYSNVVVVKAPIAPPTTPINLSPIGVTANSVTLQWDDMSANEQGFEIWQTTVQGLPPGQPGWVNAATAAVNDTTFVVKRLTSGRTYYFVIRAFNRSVTNVRQFSGWSNVTSATPQ